MYFPKKYHVVRSITKNRAVSSPPPHVSISDSSFFQSQVRFFQKKITYILKITRNQNMGLETRFPCDLIEVTESCKNNSITKIRKKNQVSKQMRERERETFMQIQSSIKQKMYPTIYSREGSLESG